MPGIPREKFRYLAPAEPPVLPTDPEYGVDPAERCLDATRYLPWGEPMIGLQCVRREGHPGDHLAIYPLDTSIRFEWHDPTEEERAASRARDRRPEPRTPTDPPL